MSSEAPRLLVVEDDDGDALIVEELLIDSGEQFVTERVTSLAAAMDIVGKVDCALVDLALPDADGLTAVQRLRAHEPDLPIVVLTGLGDRDRAIASMTAGAQDYLVKGDVDGASLARAVRYAIERRRTDTNARQLLMVQNRQQENERLARGLLPVLQLDGPVTVATRYRPGADATLGGDFYDAWTTPDGVLRAVIGDVCGHGPAEAAVGVALRIAWRTHTLAGTDPAATMAGMERLLVAERDDPFLYATVCDISIDMRTNTMTTLLHGHPAPILLGNGPQWIFPSKRTPPLGVDEQHQTAEPIVDALGDDWAVLLLTDGVYEGKSAAGRLGESGLVDILRANAGLQGGALLDAIIDDVQTQNGGDLDDDLAMVWFGKQR